jgi:NADH pyrophosphatase NudC (nudix superfamily)
LKRILLLEGIDCVITSGARRKGKLSIKYFDRAFAQDDPAYVEFATRKREKYVTLNVDNGVWQKAINGDSFSNEILAHEVGHILLHDHHENAFSMDPAAQRPFEGTSKEDFAEWQAITFAGHLLIPNRVAQKFKSVDVLATATNTTEALAKSRLIMVQSMKAPLRRPYENDVCGNCGNVTLLRRGCIITCDTCKQTYQL